MGLVRLVAARIRASYLVASWHQFEEATTESCVDEVQISWDGNDGFYSTCYARAQHNTHPLAFPGSTHRHFN
jgi:hypothetical protein